MKIRKNTSLLSLLWYTYVHTLMSDSTLSLRIRMQFWCNHWIWFSCIIFVNLNCPVWTWCRMFTFYINYKHSYEKFLIFKISFFISVHQSDLQLAAHIPSIRALSLSGQQQDLKKVFVFKNKTSDAPVFGSNMQALPG